MNSLERSLQAGLLGTLIVLLCVLWWVISLTVRMLGESYVFNDLEQIAMSASAHVEVQEGAVSFDSAVVWQRKGATLVLESASTMLTIPPTIVVESDIAGLNMPSLAPGVSDKMSYSLAHNEHAYMLGWFGGFSIQGKPYVLGAVNNTGDLFAKVRVLQIFMAVLFAALLATVALVQRVIIRRAIDKLDEIRRDMLRLEHGHSVALSQEVPSEVLPLVVEFNQLLRRFEQRLRQSRNAVGNLAHSLKGPLNLLIRSSQAESIGANEQEVIEQNAQAIRVLIESELKRARLAGRGAVGVRFDANAELPAMISLLEQVYREKQPRITFHVERDVQLVHDRQDMLELIGNLLDNAAKWCTSEVRLSMRHADGVVIEVEDDGPGCSPEVLGRLTGRGVRLDESVDGHGLGLSIVNDIVDTYEGRLSLTPSLGMGGLKAVVFLPTRA